MGRYRKQAVELRKVGKGNHARAQVPILSPGDTQVIPYDVSDKVTAEDIYNHVADVRTSLGGVNRVQGFLIRQLVDNVMAIREIDLAIRRDKRQLVDERILTIGSSARNALARVRMSHEKRVESTVKSLGLLPMQTAGFDTMTEEDEQSAKLSLGP